MAGLLDEIEADDRRCARWCSPAPGEVFSAGADLKVVAQGRGMDIARGKGGFAGIVSRDFPKPIIAAVNGPALAGGFEIVLVVRPRGRGRHRALRHPRGAARAHGRRRRAHPAAQARAARDRARARDDRRPDRRRPRARARPREPRRAARPGASTRRARSPSASARTRPIAVRLSRQLVREAAELPEAEGWRRTNELAVQIFASGDAVEGATAFAEKRKPVWKST